MDKKRKPNRLKEHNYNLQGYYYITICTKNRLDFFGKISNNIMHLSQIGKIANKFWDEIPEHFKYVELDEFIIMPDHIHGIIILKDSTRNKDVGTADLRSFSWRSSSGCSNQKDLYSNRSKMVVSKVIHGFKSSVTRVIRKQFDNSNFEWQKSYYDHVIRNGMDLNRIREYIINNPVNWEIDKTLDVED